MFAAAPAAAPRARAVARYSTTAIVLHWLIALLMLAQIFLGWWMQTVPKQPPGLRAGWFNLHKSIGLTVALLVVLRIAWRLSHKPPPLPDWLPAWQRAAAATVHRALYACLLLMPLSGYLGSSFSGYPVRYFGIVLPRWSGHWAAGKAAMGALHEAAAWTLMLLLVLHVLAALWHAVQRDGIFSRIWPTLKGDPE